MRKNNKNQKRTLIFSTAVVILGCLATALYVNQTVNTAGDYTLDLSQLNVSDDIGKSMANDPDFNSGVSLARVSGDDMVNEVPVEEEPKENKQKATMQDKNKMKIKTEESTETSSDSVISFSPQDGIGWPLPGNVILNYSMDSAVYFATLEQYKYNPAILIEAEIGDAVSACAKGQVVKIAESAELGQYVVMNIGSGYEITYGQLGELQVQEGAIVSKGQVIGNVAQTTKYYAVEGNHVYLMIEKDGEPVDPLSLLQ